MARIILSEKLVESEFDKDSMEYMKECLNVEGRHYDGKYKVIVHRSEEKGMWSTSYPFAEGNFNITLGLGRKSAKKLDTIETLMADNIEKLAGLWKDGQYATMASNIKELVYSKIKF